LKDLFSLQGEIAVVTGALGKLGPIWIETLLEAEALVFALDHKDAQISQDFKSIQSRFDEKHLQLAVKLLNPPANNAWISSECLLFW
jgi:hypothetical protein